MDEYDARIEELKDQKLEIGGQLAPLAHDDPRRAWWHQRAGELDDELRMLMDHSVWLRHLDARIAGIENQINAAGSRLDGRAEHWRLAGWWLGTAAGLASLLSVWTILLPWTPLVALALVSGCAYARSRFHRIPHEADEFIVAQGREMDRLRAQRDTILKSTGQSPSASNPAQAEDRSSGYSSPVSTVSDSSWS